MSNEIQVFEFKADTAIRTIIINDEPHFVAKDIALALGYSNTNQAIIDHCKGVVKHDLPVNTGSIKSDGTFGTKIVKVNVIPESDLYRLIFHSELPDAEKFQDWVFEEVLPSLRKTGSYDTKQKQAKPKQPALSAPYKESAIIMQSFIKVGKLLGTDEPMAKAVAVEQTRRITGVDFKELLPLANVQEVPVGIRQLAKDLNISEGELKLILTENGFMTRTQDKHKTITLTDKAIQMNMGSLEPFQSPHSDHVGYQAKWFPSVVKEVINGKVREAA